MSNIEHDSTFKSIRLSTSTARRIDWRRIMDAVPATALSSKDQAIADGVEDGPSDADTQHVFDIVAAEFDRVLADTTRVTNLFIAGAIAAMLLTVAGLAIYVFVRANVFGVTFNLVGVGSMFWTMRKAQDLRVDIALLRLIPQTFRLALNFARTPAERKDLINRFLVVAQPRR